MDYNNVIELYNPTDSDIDLTQYSIVLTPENGAPIIQNLYGVINAEQTALISNFNSNSNITSVAEVISALINMNGMVQIELKKGNNVKDRIGQTNTQNLNAVEINLIDLLANPAYINGQYIDLSSIASLNIRRNIEVQKGSLVFDQASVINEWLVYPTTSLEDLGHHNNICSMSSEINSNHLKFKLINDITIEGDEKLVTYKLISGGITNSSQPGTGETLDAYINITIDPNTGTATPNVDYFPNEVYNVYHETRSQGIIVADPVNTDYHVVAEINDDNLIEGNENFTFIPVLTSNSDANILPIIYSYEAVILDDDDPNSPVGLTSLEDHGIEIYPTITTGLINIKADTDFSKGWISNQLGQAIQYFTKEDLTINIESLPKGYYNIHFFSKEMYATSKIIRL